MSSVNAKKIGTALGGAAAIIAAAVARFAYAVVKGVALTLISVAVAVVLALVAQYAFPAFIIKSAPLLAGTFALLVRVYSEVKNA